MCPLKQFAIVRLLLPVFLCVFLCAASISDGQPTASIIQTKRPLPSGEAFFNNLPKQEKPELPVRGALIELLKPVRKDVNIFKGYLNAIARAGGNTVVFYHNPAYVKMLRDGKVDKQWWDRAELEEIIHYAHSLGLKIIPGMSSKFRQEEFPQLVSGTGNQFYNPFDDTAYTEIFSLYEVLLDIYKPEALLIGHDEIKNIGRFAPPGRSDAQILTKDVNKIHGWLLKRSIKTLMFGDMLLDHNRFGKDYYAHSNHRPYKAKDTHLAADLIPKDIIILDWQYLNRSDYPTIKYFRDKGFSVWGISWFNPEAAVSLAKSVKTYGGEGMLSSDWGLWRTFTPAATSLYALAAAWGPVTITDSGEDAIAALADSMRLPCNCDPTAFKPLPFVAERQPAQGKTATSKKLLGSLGSFDLRSFPAGNQKFDGIPFAIEQNSDGSINGSLLARGPGSNKLSVSDIRVDALAFLQTMRAAQPNIFPSTVGYYDVIYRNGHREHIELIENYNITDFISNPGRRKTPWHYDRGLDILLGSRLAWRGRASSGDNLNVQTLTWENPYPDDIIECINLYANKGYEILLLGMSAADHPETAQEVSH